MTPALLAPLGLIALAAVAIPLAIHLARRTEMRPVDFAALRWLDPRLRPRQRLRFDEKLLLAVRIALIALAAMLLARPVLWGAGDRRPVVAVFPGVAVPAMAEDARPLWLSPGFPAAEGSAPAAPDRPASLIRQLDAELPPGVPLTIWVPPVLDGMDAERPRLSRTVEWRVAEGPVQPAAQPEPLPPVVIRHGPAMRDAARYFRAAAAALAEGEPDVGTSDEPLPESARHVVWLADGPVPDALLARVADGAVLLVGQATLLGLEAAPRIAWRDEAGQPLASERRHGRGRVLQLLRPVDPGSMPVLVEAAFPDRLAELMFTLPPPARADAASHAPVAGAAAYPQPPRDLTPWLVLAMALLFAAERWLATRPGRVIAP